MSSRHERLDAVLHLFLLLSLSLLLSPLAACRAAAPVPAAETAGSGSAAAAGASSGEAAAASTDCRVPEATATDREAQAALGAAYKACFERSGSPEDARRAVVAYVAAAQLGRQQEGRLLYTSELAGLLVKLGDKRRLEEVFSPFLKADAAKDQDGYYLALVDYADALASLKDDAAWQYFERAIDLHPQNNVEAINRYARHLIDRGEPAKAAEMLERRLTRDQRIRLVRPAYLRQEALRRAGLDTAPADAEVAAIESRRPGRSGRAPADAARPPGTRPGT